MTPRSRIWNPAAYQGGRTARRYFEGWYYKQVIADANRTLAVIPGVSYSADGTSKHAFVQIVPSSGATHYFAFPIEEFGFDETDPFEVRVGPNRFSRRGLTLDLVEGGRSARGELRFGPWTPWPVTALSPGIMGPFRFVPRMETYHGVLSMDHAVSGTIEVDGTPIAFDGGRGYAEKDWGRSFPSSWIWAQSNHFGDAGTSVMLSAARIPWMTGAFVGTIAGLLHEGTLHRFATYTGARIVCIETGPNEAHITLGDRREPLEIHLVGSETLVLKAPVLGAMEGRDAESLGGTIDVTLHAVRGGRSRVAFRGIGRQAGVEIMNHRDELGRIACEAAGLAG
ncbi:MAG: tocopherol cyclase family protein [Coriobacteriia bacterium]|nr:tocopherol cyclase family protein [Coriobacteriia bacterium]